MSYLHYTTSRSRERDYDDDDSYSPRPLIRRNSKRQRIDVFEDDDADDYPYSSSYNKPSRALTIRPKASQIEKYNIWSPSTTQRYSSSSDRKTTTYSDDEDDRYRTVRVTRYTSRPERTSDDEDEKEFRLKVKATFGRSKPKRSESRDAHFWSGDSFRRREKWEGEDWERREVEKGSWWDDEPASERTTRYRRIKRTRTDEWKPLRGFVRR